ncbi:putative Prostaglandin F synthase [Cardiosporidium cionae]|uniref:Prostaglandin F synthase n=1 Tax=Cardiosporidium cionae TaxID=476202 RepID=A0ABQ7JDT2_9APIC|nr:putative Prostaglandin F synthase [Cardiosporidium cionae]|eukprot:KAF8822108.1 putative Prostaglandin F synthase [Cardiosporidium cionae]
MATVQSATPLKEATLYTGKKIPNLGIGTWKLANEKATSVVYNAIKLGYRHIDCASIYENEVEVGKGIHAAISEGICRREDLFVTSKLWNTDHRKEHVPEAIKRTLSDLQLTYLDLYLIHFPLSLKYVDPKITYPGGWIHDPSAKNPKMELDDVTIEETWRAMESLVDLGLTKHIGLSNFDLQLLQDLLKYCRVKPAALQTELHPHLVQKHLVRFCSSRDIVITSYSPFDSKRLLNLFWECCIISFGFVSSHPVGKHRLYLHERGVGYVEIGFCPPNFKQVLQEETVLSLAKKYNRTPAQIILRSILQRDDKMTVIPKATSQVHLEENRNVYDFTLSKEDVEAMTSLSTQMRFNNTGIYTEKLFGEYFPIFD